MVIRARLAFLLTNCAADRGKTLPDYWREILRDHLVSISDQSAGKRILSWQRDTAKAGKSPEPKQFLCRSNHPRHAGTQNVLSPYGLHAITEMNNVSVRTTDCFLWRIERIFTGEILRCRERRKIRWPDFFSETTIKWMTTTLADGIDLVFQYRQRFPPAYERPTKRSTQNVRSVSEIIWASGAGGSHALPIRKTKSRSLT
jgi:hypothetical protein